MTENIADFVSAYIIGNLLQMAFRFWAFRRFVFPDEFARNPEKALESTLTGGGIAEALEDEYELRHPRRRRRQRHSDAAQPPALDAASGRFRRFQGVEDLVAGACRRRSRHSVSTCRVDIAVPKRNRGP